VAVFARTPLPLEQKWTPVCRGGEKEAIRDGRIERHSVMKTWRMGDWELRRRRLLEPVAHTCNPSILGD
jgi:hypothetical protein